MANSCSGCYYPSWKHLYSARAQDTLHETLDVFSLCVAVAPTYSNPEAPADRAVPPSARIISWSVVWTKTGFLFFLRLPHMWHNLNWLEFVLPATKGNGVNSRSNYNAIWCVCLQGGKPCNLTLNENNFFDNMLSAVSSPICPVSNNVYKVCVWR
jgi:hypothetical protein